MRTTSLLLTLFGSLVFLAGLVFTLQGMGVVGPQSSIMFENPTWVYQGIGTAVVGLLIVLGGVLVQRRKAGVGSPA